MSLLPPLEQFLAFLSEDPLARGVQAVLLLGAVLLVFLVFSVTRDILQRTRSLTAQILCILLVAALPFVGFLLYLLLRPPTTLAEREREEMLREALSLLKQLNAAAKFPLPQSQFPSLRQGFGRQTSKSQAPIPTSTLIARETASSALVP